MPNRRKSLAAKRDREIKLALTQAEYEQVVQWATEAGYPPAVFARLAVLGMRHKSSDLNLVAWSRTGNHLAKLDRLLELAVQAQQQSVVAPAALTQLMQQEMLGLRQACRDLIPGSPTSEETS